MGTSTPDGVRTSQDDVLAVLRLADGAGARLWIDGGWGVDALLGTQTREHGDLDVAIESAHLPAFVAALTAASFGAVGEAGAAPWNFLVARPGGPVVDLHVIVRDADGNGVLGPPERDAVHPAASPAGRGTIGGRAVDCIAPEWVVRFHDAYPGDATDRADVHAICERFGLPVPAQYR
ncbi:MULTISPECIES: nucleotidyltransferase domain-containing protein [Catenuloplanes]|uniref:Lincosamide nucleotidyltransferase A/C/D/E n=1 Tax=Catenuloplanes niger TaxID=587534 RepID=A0AAE3ZY76_9ACTN|nr:hypothetical protein [Catenuloplanes niger]MDR7328102.1 lincosamide nucleotidyltransferase A/C/D/E [Catenuloplanes niger]